MAMFSENAQPMTHTEKLKYSDYRETVVIAGMMLTEYSHGIAKEAGWWTNLETGRPVERNVGELLMLVNTELSEAMEGHRKNLMDDKLPNRKMLEVELADALIRIFDMAGGLGLDVAGAMVEKMVFNTTREDHKIANRIKPDGKKC